MTEHPLGLQESLDPMWDLNPFLFVCEIHNYNTHSSQEVRLVQPSASRNLSTTTTTSAAHRRSPSKVLCPLTALHSCSTMCEVFGPLFILAEERHVYSKNCRSSILSKPRWVFFLPPEKNFKDTKVSTGEGWTEQPPWFLPSITKWQGQLKIHCINLWAKLINGKLPPFTRFWQKRGALYCIRQRCNFEFCHHLPFHLRRKNKKKVSTRL